MSSPLRSPSRPGAAAEEPEVPLTPEEEILALRSEVHALKRQIVSVQLHAEEEQDLLANRLLRKVQELSKAKAELEEETKDLLERVQRGGGAAPAGPTAAGPPSSLAIFTHLGDERKVLEARLAAVTAERDSLRRRLDQEDTTSRQHLVEVEAEREAAEEMMVNTLQRRMLESTAIPGRLQALWVALLDTAMGGLTGKVEGEAAEGFEPGSDARDVVAALLREGRSLLGVASIPPPSPTKPAGSPRFGGGGGSPSPSRRRPHLSLSPVTTPLSSQSSHSSVPHMALSPIAETTGK